MSLDLETFRLRAETVYPKTTVRRKLVSVSKYDSFLSSRGLKPGLESLAAWVDELRKSGVSPRTVSAYARDVLTYFDFMMLDVDERRLKMFKKMLPPVRLDMADFLTKDEVERLIKTTTDLRRKIIYLLMFAYARRLGEVLNATVDFERNTVTFPILKKKSGETATYPLEPKIRELLEEYMQYVKGRKLFNITPRAVEIGFKKDCERAGIEPNGRRLRPHILRHTRITLLREAGVPLDVISKFLARHSSITTTVSFYMGVTEEMKAAIPKAEDMLKL